MLGGGELQALTAAGIYGNRPSRFITDARSHPRKATNTYGMLLFANANKAFYVYFLGTMYQIDSLECEYRRMWMPRTSTNVVHEIDAVSNLPLEAHQQTRPQHVVAGTRYRRRASAYINHSERSDTTFAPESGEGLAVSCRSEYKQTHSCRSHRHHFLRGESV